MYIRWKWKDSINLDILKFRKFILKDKISLINSFKDRNKK